MLVRSSAAVAALCFAAASTASAHAADPVLNGTYRLDFDGQHRTIAGAASPTTNTSATYTFTSSCGQSGCAAHATLLNTNDTEPVSAHNPDLTLQFTDGAWQVSLPYDSPCEDGTTRNQLLTWSLTPQAGDDVLSGFRIVATAGGSCAGDQLGPLAQPMTATRVGSAAPGVLPMP
jgi:serine/threonine-protein kinase